MYIYYLSMMEIETRNQIKHLEYEIFFRDIEIKNRNCDMYIFHNELFISENIFPITEDFLIKNYYDDYFCDDINTVFHFEIRKMIFKCYFKCIR